MLLLFKFAVVTMIFRIVGRDPQILTKKSRKKQAANVNVRCQYCSSQVYWLFSSRLLHSREEREWCNSWQPRNWNYNIIGHFYHVFMRARHLIMVWNAMSCYTGKVMSQYFVNLTTFIV
jgi:hypothetical protein